MTDQPHDLRRVRGRYAGYTRTRLAQFARRLDRAIYPDRVPADAASAGLRPRGG